MGSMTPDEWKKILDRVLAAKSAKLDQMWEEATSKMTEAVLESDDPVARVNATASMFFSKPEQMRDLGHDALSHIGKLAGVAYLECIYRMGKKALESDDDDDGLS